MSECEPGARQDPFLTHSEVTKQDGIAQAAIRTPSPKGNEGILTRVSREKCFERKDYNSIFVFATGSVGHWEKGDGADGTR